jgi:hypothetical protein
MELNLHNFTKDKRKLRSRENWEGVKFWELRSLFCRKVVTSSLDFQNIEKQVIKILSYMKIQAFLSCDAVSICNLSPTFMLYHLGPP